MWVITHIGIVYICDFRIYGRRDKRLNIVGAKLAGAREDKLAGAKRINTVTVRGANICVGQIHLAPHDSCGQTSRLRVGDTTLRRRQACWRKEEKYRHGEGGKFAWAKPSRFAWACLTFRAGKPHAYWFMNIFLLRVDNFRCQIGIGVLIGL